LGFLREGDALMVTKPDRLARSTHNLLSIEAGLTKRGVGLIVLSIGGRKARHAKPDIEVDADHPGRRGNLGAGDHARTPA
jgi:hypothetical protein